MRKSDQENLKEFLHYNSISIGMGMGNSEDVYKIIKFFLNNYTGNLIIDADGLNALATYGVDVLGSKNCKVVLTPHIGEFSRLCAVDKKEILNNPIEYAKDFANKYYIILLLKNAVSVITDGEQIFINTTGTPSMAKAGSGDVLSGIVAGITARTEDTLLAVVASAYIFGRCGEIATDLSNEYTVVATELIDAMPSAINSLFK